MSFVDEEMLSINDLKSETITALECRCKIKGWRAKLFIWRRFFSWVVSIKEWRDQSRVGLQKGYLCNFQCGLQRLGAWAF